MVELCKFGGSVVNPCVIGEANPVGCPASGLMGLKLNGLLLKSICPPPATGTDNLPLVLPNLRCCFAKLAEPQKCAPTKGLIKKDK